MKHELEDQLKAFEKKGIDRRHFFKLMAMAGLLTAASTQKAKAFSSKAKGKIVIIGGGAAGISMAARLKSWLDKPDITLIDPSDRQFYQPGFTLIASGVYQPDDVWRKQEDCIPNDIKWIKDSVADVDPVWNQVTTKNNGKIAYDFLVLTPGIQINWEKVEGITQATLDKGTPTASMISKVHKRLGKPYRNSPRRVDVESTLILIPSTNAEVLPRKSAC